MNATENGRNEAFGSQDAPGMSKREYIATAILAGMVCGDDRTPFEGLAANAVNLTDALLLELARQ